MDSLKNSQSHFEVSQQKTVYHFQNRGFISNRFSKFLYQLSTTLSGTTNGLPGTRNEETHSEKFSSIFFVNSRKLLASLGLLFSNCIICCWTTSIGSTDMPIWALCEIACWANCRKPLCSITLFFNPVILKTEDGLSFEMYPNNCQLGGAFGSGQLK